jgi:hypothetical protein
MAQMDKPMNLHIYPHTYIHTYIHTLQVEDWIKWHKWTNHGGATDSRQYSTDSRQSTTDCRQYVAPPSPADINKYHQRANPRYSYTSDASKYGGSEEPQGDVRNPPKIGGSLQEFGGNLQEFRGSLQYEESGGNVLETSAVDIAIPAQDVSVYRVVNKVAVL